MKIEMGESLIMSWLRHVKECQIVQTNWKASARWELKNKEVLVDLLKCSDELFKSKYGYDIYKGNSGIEQILAQAEIDVLGLSFGDEETPIYAVDVAFHEAGLNYGSKDETISRVVKKCIRAAMCIYGYFGYTEGSIIFASPKVNPAVSEPILESINDIGTVFNKVGLSYNTRIIANSDFSESILQPVLNTMGEVADTSELFMRSLQMYNLFTDKKPKSVVGSSKAEPKKISKELEAINYEGLDGLKEMKIGVIVRTVLRKMLEDGAVSSDEVELMQTREYSKETFDIQYPLLIKADDTNGESPKRYYSTPVVVRGVRYFVCSEWFEVAANNDRPYLLKWLTLRTYTSSS
ncbi:MAG: hypothetical protein PHE09_01630 [Oscillospiraceae bacterium]|nr:hypothetical protein [Oscillospiraceae bacterium]